MHFGGVAFDGLCYALLYAWPGAIYEGNGTMQVIIDERADEEQRKGLATVLYGGETEEAKTHWWVYRAMSTTVHEPIFKPIDFEMDIERRTARDMWRRSLEQLIVKFPKCKPRGLRRLARYSICRTTRRSSRLKWRSLQSHKIIHE